MSSLRSAKCRALDVAMESLRRYAGDQDDPASRQGVQDILEDLTIHHLILSSQSEVPHHPPLAQLSGPSIKAGGILP
jgi:hypothetical protein